MRVSNVLPLTYDDLVCRLREAGCVFAEDESKLLLSSARSPAELDAMVQRRVAGEPLEYIVGWVDFCGLKVSIDPGVFIPRQRSEMLVRESARRARPGAVILDLCCGSGALGLATAVAIGKIELHASDISADAVQCAKRNLDTVGGHVYQGDLFRPLPASLRGRVNVLIANVPYVPSEAISLMPREARNYEPRLTLDGGRDGLEVLRRLAAEATSWLAPAGHLLIEVHESQIEHATAAFRGGGLAAETITCVELDTTIIVGTKAPLSSVVVDL
jgi:release factor glutamine methyltransferase